MPKTKHKFLLSKYIKYFLIILSISILSSCFKKSDQIDKSSKSTSNSKKKKNIEIKNTFALVMRGDHQNEGHCFDLKYSIDSEGEKSCQDSPEGRCISKQFFSEEACLSNPDMNLNWENGNCYSSNYQDKSKCEAEGYCKVTYFENKQDCMKNKLDWKNNHCIDSEILTPDQCIPDKDIIKKWTSSYTWTHTWKLKESLTWENGQCEDESYKTETTCKAKGYCSNLSIKMMSQCLRQEKKCISKLYKKNISCIKNGYKWEEKTCINTSRNNELSCSKDNNFYWGPYDWVSNTYGNQELFYGPIVGEVKSEKIIPPVKIKWETIIDDKVVFSGYGGWISSKWPDNSFEGIWSINRIKLVDSVTNKILIKVLDGSGNYEQTELKIEVDASPPDLTIFNPLPVTQGAVFWTKNSRIPITGESIDNVQNKELNIYNRSIDDLNQEVYTNDNKDSNGIGKIINIRSNNKEVEIDLLPLINIIEIIGIDSSGNQSSKLIKIGKDTEQPSLQLKYPTTSAGNYTNRVVTSSPEDIRIEGIVEDVGSGIDYIKWKNLNTNQEGVINTIGEWKIEDIQIVKGKNEIEIIAVDKVGNNSHKSIHTHIFDDTPPEINSITINDDYPTTTSQYVSIFINTIDHHSKIKKICIKYNNNSQPLSSDQCWTSAGDITDNKIYRNYQIGISAIKYKVYAWVKDEAGNISTLKNNGNGIPQVDYGEITFIPGQLPVVEKIIATTTNTPSTPPTSNQKTWNEGDAIYIKWSVSDEEGLSELPVSIYYQTDDELVLIATQLLNQVNINPSDISGLPCSINTELSIYGSGFTGCYKWISNNIPTEYFNIIIQVEDLTGQTVKMSSTPMNTGKVGFLVGNNNLTIDTSSMDAIFIKSKKLEQGLFTITSNSNLLFRDYHRGIIKVDPSNGLTKLLIPTESNKSSNSGDGWLLKYASLKNPTKVDENNGSIYIYDTDRIRIIEEFENGKQIIRTLIGGGNDTSNSIQNPLDLKISPITLDEYKNNEDERVFIVLPNGDIIFSSDKKQNRKPNDNDPNSFRLRYYSKSNNNITSIIPQGINKLGKDIKDCTIKSVDTSYNPETSEITKMFFTIDNETENCIDYFINPITGEINKNDDVSNATINYFNETFPYTGKNGVMYRVNYMRRYIKYFNNELGLWETFKDKIPIEEIFISNGNKLYFYTLGKIKYLRQAQKNISEKQQCLAAKYTFINNICYEESIETLYGSGYHINDGGLPTMANLNNISSFSVIENQDLLELYALDVVLNKYIKVNAGVKNLHLAGNGSKQPWINKTIDAREHGIWHEAWSGSSYTRFFVYNNKLHVTMRSPYDYEFVSLNLNTFMWEKIWSWDRFEGEQHTFINDSNGLSVGMTIDDNVRLPEYSFIAGFDPIQKKALVWSNNSINQINLNQNYQIIPLTNNDLNTSNCIIGSALPFCKISNARMQITDFHYINFPSKQGWVVGFKKLSKDLFLYKVNDYVSKIATLPNYYFSFFYQYSEVGDSKVFYCSTSGNLHKYNTSTEIDTQLNLLDGHLKCSGQTLYYSQRRNTLIFPFKQNSLSGIAEYDISDE